MPFKDPLLEDVEQLLEWDKESIQQEIEDEIAQMNKEFGEIVLSVMRGEDDYIAVPSEDIWHPARGSCSTPSADVKINNKLDMLSKKIDNLTLSVQKLTCIMYQFMKQNDKKGD